MLSEPTTPRHRATFWRLLGFLAPYRISLAISVVLAIGAAKALATVGRRLISGKQALGVELDLRNALYAKFVRLSYGYFDRHQTGQLMSRATVDLQSVRFFLGYGLI